MTAISNMMSKSFPNIKNDTDTTRQNSDFKDVIEALSTFERPCRKCVPMKKVEVYDKDRYLLEKIKGGENSYKKYHALKEKIAELCKREMEIKSFPSARILCERIAEIIENQPPQLLECFYPYKKSILLW